MSILVEILAEKDSSFEGDKSAFSFYTNGWLLPKIPSWQAVKDQAG